ncbi:Hypothetical cytosolic protein [Lactobacillus helveticus H10]|nr:Hypothetical cytosolic protein [Lactobacillus helveticus H10]
MSSFNNCIKFDLDIKEKILFSKTISTKWSRLKSTKSMKQN